MKLSDYEIKDWLESGCDDTEKYLSDKGYEKDRKYGSPVGYGLTLIVYFHKERFDRIYEIIVYDNATLIEFFSHADEWQFLLEYLPKIKQYWDGQE